MSLKTINILYIVTIIRFIYNLGLNVFFHGVWSFALLVNVGLSIILYWYIYQAIKLQFTTKVQLNALVILVLLINAVGVITFFPRGFLF